MFQLIGKTNIDFIGKRRKFFILSAILTGLGLLALVMVFLGRANMGIDFAGGVMIQGYFEQPVTTDQVRSVVTGQVPDAQITEVEDFTKPNSFIIKAKRPESEGEAQQRSNEIVKALEDAFPGNAFTRVSEHVIGPAVGESLREDARWAIFISLLGVLGYIAARFDFRSGVAATVSNFHSVLAVMGIFYVLGIEFDLLFVTALLTLAGYSLSDTVVVYDRIRENLKQYRSKGQFANAINVSINETLSRTLNTLMTFMIVVVTLFIFGGEVLQSFALAMILGVIIGSYSSIFVAAPILVEWEARSPRRFK